MFNFFTSLFKKETRVIGYKEKEDLLYFEFLKKNWCKNISADEIADIKADFNTEEVKEKFCNWLKIKNLQKNIR